MKKPPGFNNVAENSLSLNTAGIIRGGVLHLFLTTVQEAC